MKDTAPYLAPWPLVCLALTLLWFLPSCDVSLTETPEEDDLAEETTQRRPTSSAFQLVADKSPLTKGAKLNQIFKVSMEPLTARLLVNGESSARGRMKVTYNESREVEVLSTNIRRINVKESNVSMEIRFDGVDPQIETNAEPLEGASVIVDRGKASLEGVPNEEQEDALAKFSSEWFEGWFPEQPVKRRETWEIKPEVFLKALFKEEFSEGTGTVALYVEKKVTYDNREAVDISVSFDRCRGIFMEDGQKNEIQLHGFGNLYRALDTYEVIKVDLSGDVKATSPTPDGPVLSFSGPFKCNGTSAITGD